MYFGGFGGIGRAAFEYGFVDGAVLRDQLGARVFGLVGIDDAAARLAVEHFEQAAGEVAEEDVVCGIGDGLVKAYVGFALMFQMAAFAGGFEFLPPKINPLQIGIGAPFGSQRRHAAFDVAAEIDKAEKELQHLEGFLMGIRKKLSNDNFVAHAPEAVVARERKKESDSVEKIAALKQTIAELKKK